MSDPVLVVVWLVFAHLVADFVLQTDWIAINKGTGGRVGWTALGVHGFHVSLCLVPVVLAFGAPGLVYLALVTISHMVIDRWKVRATRRAESTAQDQARQRIARTGGVPTSGLGAAWTPWPGILFLADQALHMTFAIVGWLVILEGVTLLGPFVDVTNDVFKSWDRTVVHATILTGVVIASLLIVNTRGAYYFILALVSPREVTPAPGFAAAVVPGDGDGTAASASPAPPVVSPGYTVRVGPLVATVEPGVASAASEATTGAGSPAAAATAGPPAATARSATAVAPATIGAGAPAAAASASGNGAAGPAGAATVPTTASVPTGAPARIGATIGALERLLILAFLLTGAEAAVGLVIAAKTIARFKQLDDRGFAEYYLLGTLASVMVAVSSGLLAQAALSSLG
jgi:hypothetical protein